MDSFYNQEQLDFIVQKPDDSLSQLDIRLYKFSQTAGNDMTLFIYFRGVHPVDFDCFEHKKTSGHKSSRKIYDWFIINLSFR